MAEKRKSDWVAEMRKLPSLTDDEEHYRKAYLALQPAMAKHHTYDIIIDYFNVNVVEKLTRTPSSEQFNMLAVGSGEGKHELHMLKKLSPFFASIRVIAVDPNKEMLHTFCERLNSSDDTKNVQCNPFEGTYLEFIESSLAGVKFNLITCIHSMYYLGDLTNVVESMLSSLDPAGVVMLDVLGDKSYFARHLSEKPWLIERTSWRPAPVGAIRAIGETKGYTVVTYGIIHTYDCSSMLDDASEHGNLYLDFYTMTPHFRRDASPDIVEDDLSFWRENLFKENDKLMACGDDTIVIMSK